MYQLRIDLGRTKAGMAKLVGTTPTTIYRWEQGITNPLPVFVEKLEKLTKWVAGRNG